VAFIGALTAAGISFCRSLGLINPTYDECDLAIWRVMPSCDSFMECPYENGANVAQFPEAWKKKQAEFDGCVIWGSFTIIDGTTGYSHFCWRKAEFHFIPEAGTWRWTFPGHEARK
jgi:hypothetical protein